jgi:hypothetical protein
VGVEGTGPKLCSATRKSLFIKMDLTELGCEDGRWMQVALEHVQWRVWY